MYFFIFASCEPLIPVILKQSESNNKCSEKPKKQKTKQKNKNKNKTKQKQTKTKNKTENN